MPLYDYACPGCGALVEVQHAIDAGPPDGLSCPKACGAREPLQLQISRPRIARTAEPRGAIWSEKQVQASHGTTWEQMRRTGTTGREGGAGRVQYHHAAAPSRR